MLNRPALWAPHSMPWILWFLRKGYMEGQGSLAQAQEQEGTPAFSVLEVFPLRWDPHISPALLKNWRPLCSASAGKNGFHGSGNPHETGCPLAQTHFPLRKTIIMISSSFHFDDGLTSYSKALLRKESLSVSYAYTVGNIRKNRFWKRF